MITKLIAVDLLEQPNSGIIEAANIIRQGGLVAFPTETVYGLGADAQNADAANKIYSAKGRPSDNPLIVHIADFSQLEEITTEVPKEARLLADKFWPGPLTMILNKNDVIPKETTGGLDTVAIRMPNHPCALALIRQSGCMIAAPSANASGRPSTTSASHVWEDLEGRIDAILDNGSSTIGLESTIIDLTVTPPMVLRPGYITLEELRETIGTVVMDPGLNSENTEVRPKAPGMRYRHYAPRASLTIVEGPELSVIGRINQLTDANQAMGLKTGVLCCDNNAKNYRSPLVITVGERDDEDEIANHLFDSLRSFDRSDVDMIYSESFGGTGVRTAIMNRLLKAAGHQVLSIRYSRIIFASGNGVGRAPMAEMIYQSILDERKYMTGSLTDDRTPIKAPELMARGIVVQFPEPMNPKAEATLNAHDIATDGYQATAISSEDITENTLILTLERKQRNKLIALDIGATADNTFVLSDYVGEELETINPYGGELADYEMCYEMLKVSLGKLADMLAR